MKVVSSLLESMKMCGSDLRELILHLSNTRGRLRLYTVRTYLYSYLKSRGEGLETLKYYFLDLNSILRVCPNVKSLSRLTTWNPHELVSERDYFKPIADSIEMIEFERDVFRVPELDGEEWFPNVREVRFASWMLRYQKNKLEGIWMNSSLVSCSGITEYLTCVTTTPDYVSQPTVTWVGWRLNMENVSKDHASSLLEWLASIFPNAQSLMFQLWKISDGKSFPLASKVHLFPKLKKILIAFLNVDSNSNPYIPVPGFKVERTNLNDAFLLVKK